MSGRASCVRVFAVLSKSARTERNVGRSTKIAIALDEFHSSAVLSLLVLLLFVKSQLVGVGASVGRDRVGTGTGGAPAGGVWLSD